MPLQRLFGPLIRQGRLVVIDADGTAHHFGSDPSPAVTIRLHDRWLPWRLLLRPRFAVGAAFVDGTLTVEDGSIYDVLDLVGRNLAAAGMTSAAGPLDRLDELVSGLRRRNPLPRARRNAQRHYDLPPALFELFLDADRTYSCAYFRDADDDLDRAQRHKHRHIAAKLLLRPGLKVLDIGCGWGGFDLYMAEQFGAHVTGITLAEEQLKIARQRAAGRGLGDRVDFQLRDYRDETGTYDRVVSVGMFEHVGVGDYDVFFARLRDRLTEDGVALLHTIGRAAPPEGATNAWIRRYIFPGGYLPALSEVAAAIERSGLFVTDVEVLRLHYALTLRQWRARFLAQRERAVSLFGERFCRMWEFYLAVCEIAFRYLRCVVFQIQLARRQDATPLIRDYMVDAEREAAEERPPRSGRAA